MRSLALVGALVAAFTAAHASATPQTTRVIRPAQAIGKVRLGMTAAELVRAMGRPRFVIPGRTSFGRHTVEWQYGLAAYTVRLAGPPNRLRVVRVGTTLSRERTARGVGPGSSESRLIRAYPSIRCERLFSRPIGGVPHVEDQGRTCVLHAPSGRRTIFQSQLPGWRFWEMYPLSTWLRRARVIEVTVAEAS
jgi:hypothetical protein